MPKCALKIICCFAQKAEKTSQAEEVRTGFKARGGAEQNPSVLWERPHPGSFCGPKSRIYGNEWVLTQKRHAYCCCFEFFLPLCHQMLFFQVVYPSIAFILTCFSYDCNWTLTPVLPYYPFESHSLVQSLSHCLFALLFLTYSTNWLFKNGLFNFIL